MKTIRTLLFVCMTALTALSSPLDYEIEQIKKIQDLKKSGSNEEARELALATLERGLSSPENRIQILIQLGDLHNPNRLSDLAVSEQYFIRAEKEALTFGNDSITARVFNYRAANYIYQSRYPEATIYLKKSIGLIKLSGKANRLVIPYINLANVNHSQGNYLEAINYLSESEHLINTDSNPNPKYLSAIYNNRSNSHKAIGQFDEALYYIKKATQLKEQIYPENHPSLINSYISFADIQHRMGNPEESMIMTSKILQLGLPENDQLADAYDFQGRAYALKGEHKQAITSFKRSIEIYHKVYGEKNIWIADTYRHLAETYKSIHNYEEALRQYQNASQANSYGFSPVNLTDLPQFSQAIGKDGGIDLLRGTAGTWEDWYQATSNINYLLAAYDSYQLAIHWIDEESKRYRRRELLLHFGEKVHSIYDQAVANAAMLYQITGEITYAESAFYASEKNKSWLLFRSMTDASVVTSDLIDGSYRNQEQILLNDIHRIENAIQKATYNAYPSTRTIDSLRNKLFVAKEVFEELQDTIRLEFPHYYDTKYDHSVPSIIDLQNQLIEKDELLVEYHITQGGSIALFTIDKNSFDLKVVDGSDLFELVKSYRQSMDRREWKPTMELSKKLSALLVEPLNVQPQTNQVSIIPTGVLNYVPFETLPTGGNNIEMMINKYQMKYDFSAALAIKKRKESHSGEAKFSAFAPYLDIGNNSDAPTLNGKEELEQLSELITGDYFKNGSATEATFKNQSGDFSILHLATHAVANDRNPNQSYLMLSPGEEDEEDGSLYAYELYNMQLKTDLVTLSACNTGYGEIKNGEGVMSLAHAFAYAGSPNIVMSLWPVPDKSTSEIMVNFYRNLIEGMPKDRALHEAKRQYLQTADDYGKHPYYWAGFVFSGNPEPLTFQQTRYAYLSWILVVIALIVLAINLDLNRVRQGVQLLFHQKKTLSTPGH